MARTHGVLTTGALIVCLVGSEWSGTLLASERGPGDAASQAVAERSAPGDATATPAAPGVATRDTKATVSRSLFTLDDEVLSANLSGDRVFAERWRSAVAFGPVESSAYGQRGFRRGRGRRNGAAQAAIVVGAVAAIAGAALLVYANRPECNTSPSANACGYGTKVVGGAVLTGGIVSVVAGALTWR
jgi:hypothetical protein